MHENAYTVLAGTVHVSRYPDQLRTQYYSWYHEQYDEQYGCSICTPILLNIGSPFQTLNISLYTGLYRSVQDPYKPCMRSMGVQYLCASSNIGVWRVSPIPRYIGDSMISIIRATIRRDGITTDHGSWYLDPSRSLTQYIRYIAVLYRTRINRICVQWAYSAYARVCI